MKQVPVPMFLEDNEYIHAKTKPQYTDSVDNVTSIANYH